MTNATEKMKPSPKLPAVPTPTRLDIDLDSAEEANGMVTPVLDKKKNEFFKVNTRWYRSCTSLILTECDTVTEKLAWERD